MDWKNFLIFICLLTAFPCCAETTTDAYKQYWNARYAQCKDEQCLKTVHDAAIAEMNAFYNGIKYDIYNQPPEYNPEPQKIEIRYGYNARGEYVPMSVGGQRVHYGYNAYGDFVPMYIGD